ncbi:MAG: MBL fold metallo-hydrolase [Oscillospiraceae bacterium]|nr:MBL fold metallo-hydrolase [Oscillospiraceae bacterium]
MQVYTVPLGALAANCYVVMCGENRCILIDVGENPARLERLLAVKQLTPEAVLLTHGHYDHVGGVEEIRSRYEIPVYIHEADQNMLRSGDANLCRQISAQTFQPVQSYQTVRDGDTLQIGERLVRVMHTPGHTSGGVCYFIEDAVFTGDTLFAGSVGRTDLGGNVQELRQSLAALAAIEEDYQVFPGHFQSSTLRWEKTHNPCMGGGF